jgi:hypothetical protein
MVYQVLFTFQNKVAGETLRCTLAIEAPWIPPWFTKLGVAFFQSNLSILFEAVPYLLFIALSF